MNGSRIRLFAVLALTITAVFIADLLLPLGVAAGVPYIVPVLVSLYAPGRRTTIIVACICTLLNFIGFHFSAPAETHWVALTNRGLALAAIWACAFLSIERKRVGEALRETGDRLQAIIDTAADAIIVIDDHGRIESFNRGAEKLFGYSGKKVIGKNVSVLMPPPAHPVAQ